MAAWIWETLQCQVGHQILQVLCLELNSVAVFSDMSPVYIHWESIPQLTCKLHSKLAEQAGRCHNWSSGFLKPAFSSSTGQTSFQLFAVICNVLALRQRTISVGCIFRQRSSSRSFLICVMKDMFLSGHHLKCCDCCLACHSYKAVTIVWQAVFKSQSACEMLESLWTTASFSLLRRMEKKELSCLIRNEWMADLLLAKGPKGKKQLTASKLLPWVW